MTEAEQIIKSVLDGKFYSRSPDGNRICVVSVPLDYIPDHRPAYDEEAAAASGRKAGERNQKRWSKEEDDRLVALRARGLRWQVIASEMHRGDKGVRTRYYEICGERNMTPVGATVSPVNMLTPEVKAQIVKMREEGMTFPEINHQLGLIGFKARDYYARYKRELLMRRMAA